MITVLEKLDGLKVSIILGKKFKSNNYFGAVWTLMIAFGKIFPKRGPRWENLGESPQNPVRPAPHNFGNFKLKSQHCEINSKIFFHQS